MSKTQNHLVKSTKYRTKMSKTPNHLVKSTKRKTKMSKTPNHLVKSTKYRTKMSKTHNHLVKSTYSHSHPHNSWHSSSSKLLFQLFIINNFRKIKTHYFTYSTLFHKKRLTLRLFVNIMINNALII